MVTTKLFPMVLELLDSVCYNIGHAELLMRKYQYEAPSLSLFIATNIAREYSQIMRRAPK
jgi:hypothetical protein